MLTRDRFLEMVNGYCCTWHPYPYKSSSAGPPRPGVARSPPSVAGQSPWIRSDDDYIPALVTLSRVTCHVLQRHNIFCVTCTTTTYKTDINSKMHFSHTIQCFQLLLKLSSEIGNTLLYLYFTWSIVHPAPKTQICHWIARNRVDNADIYFHFKWPVTIHWDCFVSPLLMISCCKYSIN